MAPVMISNVFADENYAPKRPRILPTLRLTLFSACAWSQTQLATSQLHFEVAIQPLSRFRIVAEAPRPVKPLDFPDETLDETPSRGNIVFSNTIRDGHYAGISFAAGSDLNDVFDNVIMDVQHWALESVPPMANSSLNNLTNIQSRNIGSGLSPALIEAGRPH
jgi:hypothetical protein